MQTREKPVLQFFHSIEEVIMVCEPFLQNSDVAFESIRRAYDSLKKIHQYILNLPEETKEDKAYVIPQHLQADIELKLQEQERLKRELFQLASQHIETQNKYHEEKSRLTADLEVLEKNRLAIQLEYRARKNELIKNLDEKKRQRDARPKVSTQKCFILFKGCSSTISNERDAIEIDIEKIQFILHELDNEVMNHFSDDGLNEQLHSVGRRIAEQEQLFLQQKNQIEIKIQEIGKCLETLKAAVEGDKERFQYKLDVNLLLGCVRAYHQFKSFQTEVGITSDRILRNLAEYPADLAILQTKLLVEKVQAKKLHKLLSELWCSCPDKMSGIEIYRKINAGRLTTKERERVYLGDRSESLLKKIFSNEGIELTSGEVYHLNVP